MNRGSNILPILFCTLALTVLGCCIAQELKPVAAVDSDDSAIVRVVSSLFALPGRIVANAVVNGGIEASMFGTPAEKHAFAKGLPTRFGQMDMDADEELKSSGWSEVRIHDLGHKLGFSNLWNK